MNTVVLIAAGAVAVVAAVGVLVALVVRRGKAKAVAEDQAAWHGSSAATQGSSNPADSSSADQPSETPSAELLAPLSVGDWKPAREPAPAANLPAVSLAERTRVFEAAIPEVVPRPTVPIAPTPATAATAPAAAPTPTPAPTLLTAAAPAPAPAWQPPQVAAAPLPVVVPPQFEPAEPERPKAHARPLPEPTPATAPPATLVWPDEPASPPSRPAEFAEMVAPVEMWFGDYRVGVKSGSKTHAQFRKYADALLNDLKGDRARVR